MVWVVVFFFFLPQIKTLSRISMEWAPQVVDKAEAERHEETTEEYLRVGRKKGDDGGEENRLKKQVFSAHHYGGAYIRCNTRSCGGS